MAHNVQMPRFTNASGASGAAKASDWGDVDNFDVEMLAEYLLNDDGDPLMSGGIAFDFGNLGDSNHGQQGTNSTLVSPENSEDGNHPLVADATNEFIAAAMNNFQQQQQQAPGNFTSQMPSTNQGGATATNFDFGIPIAPATTNGAAPFAGLTAEQLQSMGIAPAAVAPASLQQQPAGVSTDSNTAKRRRVEDGSVPGQLAAVAEQGKGRKKNQAQVDRRRERNRILARRTRLRKKFFFESLQKEVVDLQRENQQLKDIVRTNLDGDESKKILDECDAAEKLPPGVLEACGELTSMDSKDFNLVRSIQSSQHSFIITDPSLEDNPIVFASDDFLKLTGYSREQVLGRNCRFLQGTDTSKETVEEIRKGLASGEDVSVTLVNYTADGTPFWNKLFIAALRDAQDNIVNFIGVAVKVASPEPGHPEHGKVLQPKPTKDAAESILNAMEDSVTAAVAAAGGQ